MEKLKKSVTNLLLCSLAFILLLNGCRSKSEKNGGIVQPDKSSISHPSAGQGASIHEAALNGDLDRVSLLLDKGCNVDTLDQDGRTALMYAAFNGHTAVINKLILRSTSVNIQDINGRTALMMASSGPFQESVKLLLENYADPNLTDKVEHFSALMFAASEGQTEVVRILIAHNADPFMKDADGDDAITFAFRNNHKDAAALLKSLMEMQRTK